MGYRVSIKPGSKEKQCEKFELHEPFRRIEVPRGAKMLQNLEIGTNGLLGGGVKVQLYAENGSRGTYSFKL